MGEDSASNERRDRPETSAESSGRWFPYDAPDCAVGMRLYCGAHSGASCVMYRDWIGRIEGVIVRPVERPGRGTRWMESPFTEMGPLVEAMADAVVEDLGSEPYALMGHSVGGLIAYELTHAIRRRGARGPGHLIVSGHAAPDRMQERHSLGAATDEAILDHLRRLGGTPAEILDHPAAARLLLPAFRADSALSDTYRYLPREPLEIPITAITATNDARAGEVVMSGWRDHTTGVFVQRTLHGGHFAILRQREAVLRHIGEALRSPNSATR